MPHVYDSSRWATNRDGTHVRRVGVSDSNATEGALELAASYGLDLSDVEGTGKDGRVTKADVEAYLAEDDAE